MPTVLIVDDEPDVRLLLRLTLDAAGIGAVVVGEARDGVEALAAWRELDPPPIPDVVILDNRMPGKTGLEVAAEMLALRPDQVIILFTAYPEGEARRQAGGLGVAAYVSKDDFDLLPAMVRELAQSSS